MADDCDIKHLNMLIESENIQSLNLVKKLGYQIISKWNYFSLPSKNNSHGKIKFESIDINELNFKGMRFVDSWRWIPLTKDNFENLYSSGNVLCQKNDGVVQSLGIISESNSFDDTIILTIIFGTLFFLSNLDHDKKLNLPQAFLLTALSWLSIAVFGSLPFIFSSLNLNITDAFFESMSGITTTGSTVINNLDIAPKSILLWRAILQWLGGIGIIVMAITLMPIMNVGGMQLFKISSNDNAEKILPRSKEISLRLIIIYSALTFLCGLFYKIFGMNFFDSLTPVSYTHLTLPTKRIV
mgnify:CR=1 FL=1